MTLQLALTADNITEVEVLEDLSDANMIAFLPAAGWLEVTDDAGVVPPNTMTPTMTVSVIKHLSRGGGFWYFHSWAGP